MPASTRSGGSPQGGGEGRPSGGSSSSGTGLPSGSRAELAGILSAALRERMSSSGRRGSDPALLPCMMCKAPLTIIHAGNGEAVCLAQSCSLKGKPVTASANGPIAREARTDPHGGGGGLSGSEPRKRTLSELRREREERERGARGLLALPRVSPLDAVAINETLGVELRSKQWTDKSRETVSATAKLDTTIAIARAPVVQVASDSSSGASGASATAIFGSSLDALGDLREGLLDLTSLDSESGLELPLLAPLASPAATQNPAAAYIACGAATDPALCRALAAVMRQDGDRSLLAITGVSSFLSGSITSLSSGVYALPSGGTLVDTDGLMQLSLTALTERVGNIFADAGRRLAAASRRRPIRAGSGVCYDNAIYALALADPGETAHSLATRVVRLASAVAKARAGVTPMEVVTLILAAAVVMDTLYFAPLSMDQGEGFKLLVAAFADAVSTSNRRPLRGIAPHLDVATVRAAINRAVTPSGPARAPAPAVPTPAATPSSTQMRSPGTALGYAAPAGQSGPAAINSTPLTEPPGRDDRRADTPHSPPLAQSRDSRGRGGRPEGSRGPGRGSGAGRAPVPGINCILFASTGTCRYGDRCRFDHVPQAAAGAADAPAPPST